MWVLDTFGLKAVASEGTESLHICHIQGAQLLLLTAHSCQKEVIPMSMTIGRLPLSATTAMIGLSMVAACTQGPDIQAYMESTSKAIVASVTSTEDGFVVIHPRQEDGKPDMSIVLGNVLVAAGSGTEAKLTLDEEMPAGTSLVAVLYSDAGKKGHFEPGIDLPVNVNGSTVRDSFVVK